MTHYVIDTNFVHLDYFLKGTFITILCQSSEVLRHKVYMPEVVFDELVKQHREELEKQIIKAHDIEKDVYRLTEKKIAINLCGIEEDGDNYSVVLKRAIEEQGIELLPYPQVPHQDVVQRVLHKRKPFREFEQGTTGYRDTLIWETVLELCGQTGYSDKVVLLTNNTQDFGGKGKLHKHLVEDCVERGYGEEKVKLVSAFYQFITKEILPASQKLENIILNAWKAGEIDLLEVAREHVNDREISHLLEYDDVSDNHRYTPTYYETTEVTWIKDSCNYCIYDFRKLPKGDLLVSVRVDVYVGVDCFIYKGDLLLIDDDEMPYIFDKNWNEHYVAASDEAELTVQYDIRIDSDLKHVINVGQRLVRSRFETGYECEEKG